MIRDNVKIIVTPTGVSLEEVLTKEVVKALNEEASIFRFISFKELKDMAIERLTKSLEQHQKMYEEL